MILVIMGVSGSGKTEVGSLLATKETDGQVSAVCVPAPSFPSGYLVVTTMLLNGNDRIHLKLGWKFYDADDYHPVENKGKMSRGIPLNDQDRHPWLCKLHEIMTRENDCGEHVVVACSALKKAYRTTLITGNNPLLPESPFKDKKDDISSETLFVHLQGSLEMISERMQKRKGHFMPLRLLQSQFDTLEPPVAPERFININVDRNISEIVSEIQMELEGKLNSE